MASKYSLVLLLATALVILCLTISSVEADARYNEECVDQNNHPKHCERSKAYMCDRQTRRCSCAAGTYNKDQDRCTVRLGEVCALNLSDSPSVACNSRNAFCESNRQSPNYQKCTCREGEDCSAGFAVGPTAATMVIGLAASAMVAFIKM